MTSSAPFPGEPTMEELASPKHGMIVELEDGYIRGMVPSFYEDHPDKDRLVTHKGAPLLSLGKPFKIAQVPIERRWAIRPNGEVLDELEFRKYYVLYYHEFFRELVRANPDLKGRADGGRPDNDIPDPLRYVAMQVDASNPKQFVPANYEPFSTAGAHSMEFHTRDGEPVDADRLQVLCNAFADPRLRSKLRPHERNEARAALGLEPEAGSDSVIAKLELLNAMKADGAISDEEHSRQVGLLTGAKQISVEPHETPPPQPSPDGFTKSARCGKSFTKATSHRAAQAVVMHERRCRDCNSAAPNKET